jgi:hypothetical protein
MGIDFAAEYYQKKKRETKKYVDFVINEIKGGSTKYKIVKLPTVRRISPDGLYCIEEESLDKEISYIIRYISADEYLYATKELRKLKIDEIFEEEI